MAKNKKQVDPIPDHFNSIEEAGEFWDEHSLADYWDQTKEVYFDIEIEEEPRYIVLERKLAKKINEWAKKEKVSPEILVNLWVSEKIQLLSS
jgi:hypothetical protein